MIRFIYEILFKRASKQQNNSTPTRPSRVTVFIYKSHLEKKTNIIIAVPQTFVIRAYTK